jgi:hypothetical protein
MDGASPPSHLLLSNKKKTASPPCLVNGYSCEFRYCLVQWFVGLKIGRACWCLAPVQVLSTLSGQETTSSQERRREGFSARWQAAGLIAVRKLVGVVGTVFSFRHKQGQRRQTHIMMGKKLCLSSWPLLLSSLCRYNGVLLLQSTSTLVLATATTTDQMLQVEYAYGDGSMAFFADDVEDNADNIIGNHNEWRSAKLPSASDDSDDHDANGDDEEHHHDDHDDEHHHDHNDHDHDHADGGGCRFHRLSQADEIADSARMTAWRAKRFDSSNNSIVHNNLFLRGKPSSTPQKYTIPVYVHVVQANFFWGNQSDEDIAAALKYLNEAFHKAAAPFVFEHKATTRTTNAKWGEGCGNDQIEIEFKKVLKKGGADTLNLYLCPKIVDQRGSILNGYAFAPFPGSDTFMRDGVVVAGRGLPQHNTIVHEVRSILFVSFVAFVNIVRSTCTRLLTNRCLLLLSLSFSRSVITWVCFTPLARPVTNETVIKSMTRPSTPTSSPMRLPTAG